MPRKQRMSRKKREELRRVVMIIIAAIIVGLIVVFVAQVLEKPMDTYYPHDTERGGFVIELK